MTNKPMLSVELDLLKRLEASFSSAYACAEEFSYNDSDADAVLAELRELLGRPTPQYPLEGSGPETPRLLGDPVAVFSWDSTGYRAKLLLDHTKPFPADGTLLYAEQPEPVAFAITDDQILEAVRPAIMSADGGYVFDTAKQDVIDAGRALLAEVARLNWVKT